MNDTSQRLTIKKLAEEDRPREKMMLKGRHVLSDAELIAILIGSGTRNESAIEVGRKLLIKADNDLYKLSRMGIKEMKSVDGIGEAKAITIISALELGRRRKEREKPNRDKIGQSKDVFDLMSPVLSDLSHEEFWVLLLDRANHVLRKEQISSGGVAGTVADPKLIFKKALDCLASGVILVHNHPSGNTTPSQADMEITRKVCEGGKLLDIAVLDHIIFADDLYYSFADEGMMK
ncbi:DNA repair protein RadC [Limibacter armeniacum]|uniref:RadC family protein n=1 Tax=Limibacter armeniacum TaxID=466084 RepID=UPI002FE543C7